MLLLLAGCRSSPFEQQVEADLRRSVLESTEREMRDASKRPASLVTKREDLIAGLGIKPEFMPTLEKLAGPQSYDWSTLELGEDLTGQPIQSVTMSLERVLRTAVEHNIAVQFARLNPAVSEAQVQAAEAAFDWTFFSAAQWSNSNSPQVSVSGSPGSTDQQQLSGNAGLRRSLVGGGRFTAQLDTSYTDNNLPVSATNNTSIANPNPANQAAFVLQWDQPLLRNAGSEVSQAEIRVARNAERNSVQTLRRDLIRVVTDTERTYWALVRAVHDVLILERLLERGLEVQKQLEQRTAIDANQAQIADARARVERRRADVQRSRVQVRVLNDQLKALMNDPMFPVGSEVAILPADRPVDQPVKFSLLESLRQAVAFRPEVQQAVIAIDDASIRQVVARNARLPDLTARLQTRWSSLDNTVGEAYRDLFSGSFIDYLAGLAFEQPIGNRRAEAQYRQRRLERMQTVLAYRNSVQQAAGEVKGSLDRIVLNYRLIEQTRSFRLAATETLRVLQLEKDVRLGYTVERLDFELRQQEQVALAEREEITALTEFNEAIAALFQAMGTALERNNVRVVVPTSDETLENWDDAFFNLPE